MIEYANGRFVNHGELAMLKVVIKNKEGYFEGDNKALFIEDKMDAAAKKKIEAEGLYVYQLRGDGADNKVMSIENSVLCDFVGTVITEKEIKFPTDAKDKYLEVIHDKDIIEGEEASGYLMTINNRPAISIELDVAIGLDDSAFLKDIVTSDEWSDAFKKKKGETDAEIEWGTF